MIYQPPKKEDESSDDQFMDADQDIAGPIGYQQDEDFPIDSCLNRYLLGIVVVRKQEVRMYDIANGSLVSLHSNIFNEI